MGINRAFSAELMKIAGIGTRGTTTAVGATLGLFAGSRGLVQEQWNDDDRLAAGLIDEKQWKQRRAMRGMSLLASGAGGAYIGSLVPAAASQARKWADEVSSDAASRARSAAGEVRSEYEQALKNQVDYALGRVQEEIPKASRAAGREAGDAFAEALYNNSVTKGRRPEINLKHTWDFPWSRKRD